MKGKVIDTLTCIVAVGILMPVFGVPEVQTSGRTLVERQRLPGYVVVTPEGPRDGGDFGQNSNLLIGWQKSLQRLLSQRVSELCRDELSCTKIGAIVCRVPTEVPTGC